MNYCSNLVKGYSIIEIKEKGSELNICKILEKLMNESMEKGKIEEEREGRLYGEQE